MLETVLDLCRTVMEMEGFSMKTKPTYCGSPSKRGWVTVNIVILSGSCTPGSVGCRLRSKKSGCDRFPLEVDD
jgi:hypothetical protein